MQDHDAECPEAHAQSGQVLVPKKLPVPNVQGHHPSHGRSLRLRVRAGAVQVAKVAAPADGETENDLGVQNTLPRCALPTLSQKDHICGCRSGIYMYHLTSKSDSVTVNTIFKRVLYFSDLETHQNLAPINFGKQR